MVEIEGEKHRKLDWGSEGERKEKQGEREKRDPL